MRLNLQEVPFSTRGSYMAFSYLNGEYRGEKIEKGLYFRSVHGAAETSFIARIYPVHKGEEIPYSYEACPWEIRIKTEYGEAGITFADADTIVIQGNVPLCFDFMSRGKMFTFAQPWKSGDRDFYLVNAFLQNCRYMFREEKRKIDLKQLWKVSGAEFCFLTLGNNGEEYTASVEENYDDWKDKKREYLYHEVRDTSKKAFEDFCSSMPRVPEEFKEAAGIAAYVDWSGMVKPCGILKRESMFMSKNWMCNVWSWDHCFNAMALAYHNHKEAWEQFMVMFDFQTETGRIPDSVNDVKIVNNYCKPPIHGWTFRKLEEIMDISEAQRKEAYKKISRWTNWWLNCRDENQDGLCEYTHGNDSGWDNATAFSLLPPVTSPDLAGFLVLQMDVLSETAKRLGYHEEADSWKERADQMLKTMLKVLFPENQPRVLAGFEMEEVNSDSLLLYLPIVLGDRLPGEVRKNLAETIKGTKFNTEYGLATESPSSEAYEADGYWRGPVWAPSTMLILDGMMKCGETEYVQEMTRRFCGMVQKSGCAENFDALTGEGLRDRAYTWTASAMLVMAHEYLVKEDRRRLQK